LATVKNVLKVLKNVVCVTIIVFLVAIVAFTFFQRVTNATPNILGFSFFRVSSGSMMPALEIGDIILCKQVPPETLQIGDIVTYNGTKGELAGKVITHQVVSAPYETQGVYHIQTKGIVSGAINDPEITQDQLLGKMITKIPFINEVYNIFITPWGLLIFIFLLCILFSSEVIHLVKLLKTTDYDAGLQNEEDNSHNHN